MSSKDLSFLELKASDDAHMAGIKSYWRMVMDMPEDERKLFLQQERVKTEEQHLQSMIDANKRDDNFIANCINNARQLIQNYKLFDDESGLGLAEQWSEVAASTRANKYKIADIRKQREQIQWEKSKLKTMQPADEQPQSSEV